MTGVVLVGHILPYDLVTWYSSFNSGWCSWQTWTYEHATI